MAETVEIMDFAADDVVVDFYVGKDHFVALPDIPLGLMQQISKLRNVKQLIEENGDLNVIFDIFNNLLTPDSAVLFRECVEVKKTIGIMRLMRILPWLMEKYGMYPTQQPKPSSDGSLGDETGSSSTDGAPQSVSTPSTHQQLELLPPSTTTS